MSIADKEQELKLDLIQKLSREIVDVMHDRKLLSPNITRAQMRQLEEVSLPGVLQQLIAESTDENS